MGLIPGISIQSMDYTCNKVKIFMGDHQFLSHDTFIISYLPQIGYYLTIYSTVR